MITVCTDRARIDAVLVPRPQNDATVEERLSRNESVIDADADFSVAIDYRVSL